MTSTEKKTQSTRLRLNQALENNRLWEAISQLEAMAAITSAPWQMNEELENIRQSYSLLSDYAINGFDDPQRGMVLADIHSRIRRLATSIVRFSETPESPRQYFSIIRYEQLQSDSSIAGLIRKYESAHNDILRQAIFGKTAQVKSGESPEAIATRLFNIIWTSYPLTNDNASALFEALQSQALPDHFKLLLISAVTLGALEYFDEEKLILLSRAYLSESPAISSRALVGLLLNMWVHRDSLNGRRFIDAIETVKENPSWLNDLRLAYMELVRTRDTERITRKMHDEIIPQMMKIRPDILKNINSAEDAEEMMSLEENPEWAEMLDKSGLSDKLRELNDLQSDGGDIMMGTFAHLKGFSFFNEPSNWFLPFYNEQPDVATILDETAIDIAELISASTAICDSDKYSIVLSLSQIPPANRRMMLSQFKLQDINLAEIRSSQLNPEASDRANIVNKYVQDIYRFFNLYRRKNEFPNPFASPINLATVNLLADSLQKTDTLNLIGEFYFKRGYYREALDVFSIINSNSAPSAQLLQKIGYCFQQLGMIDDAIRHYEQSWMLRPDSQWTLRRLAQCYRIKGDHVEALKFYRELELRNPDDTNITLNIGHCLLAQNNIDEALKSYYKVEYLSPDSEKVIRPVAWCLFLNGDLQKSLEYYNKILASNPDSTDYLNAGHLHMALRQYREAVNFYHLSIENSPTPTVEEFLKSFNADRPTLINAGVDNQLINIVADAVTKGH